jgi:hypothetical protein
MSKRAGTLSRQAANAAACAEKILSRINVPFEVQGHQLRISASIGIASSSNKSTDSAVIPQNVDITSYVSGEVWRGQQLLDLLSLASYWVDAPLTLLDLNAAGSYSPGFRQYAQGGLQ